VRLHRAAIGVLCLALLEGCSALPHDRQWGADVTATPGWRRIGAAAGAAVRDPWVWAPVLGAAALQVGHWDRDASDWAREQTPVFGSTRDADRWSDDLRDATRHAHVATVLAASSGDTPSAWTRNKLRGVLIDLSAIGATRAMTGGLKGAGDRERPNALDHRSFPSGHASTAGVHASLASRNLEFVPLRPWARHGFDAGLQLAGLGTAWARVEAGMHYPSDVLAGVALGRFLGTLFHDALLDPARPQEGWVITVYPLFVTAGGVQ
jgi:hypothetical protein